MSPSRSSGQRKRQSLRRFFSRLAGGLNSQIASIPGNTRANGFGIEPLEPRTLFVIVGPFEPAAMAGSEPGFYAGGYEFIEGSSTVVRVSWHDLTAELIGVEIPTTGNPDKAPADIATMSDLQPEVVMPPTAELGAFPYLYTIYIIQSAPDSWISIAQTTQIPTMGTQPRPMVPFNGAPTLSVNNIGTGDAMINVTPGQGSLLLGAVHDGTTDANQPIMSVPWSASAVPGPYPQPIDPVTMLPGPLRPGVYMSPVALTPSPSDPTPNNPTIFTPETDATTPNTPDTPNDIGRFFFGGTITGSVDIPAAPVGSVPVSTPDNPVSQGGNVGIFYAGAILTGDARGVGLTDEPAADQTINFTVGGDLRDLIVGGPVGGERAGASLTVDQYKYYTGFAAQIAGTVGEIYLTPGANHDFIGSIDVEHLPSIIGLPENLFPEVEIEGVVHGPGDGGALFGYNGNGVIGTVGDPTTYNGVDDVDNLPPLLPSTMFSNNATPDQDVGGAADNTVLGTPQYLGSIKVPDPETGLPELDTSGNYIYEASVNGVLEGENPGGETFDNYAVPLMAGQTITTTLTETADDGEPVPFFIPDDDLQVQVIDPDGRIVATNQSFNANETAQRFDEPFQYTADRPGLYTFLVTYSPGAAPPPEPDIYYNLTVQGVGDMAMGALVSGEDITDGGLTGAVEIDNGDLGAMVAQSNIYSDASNTELEVETTDTSPVFAYTAPSIIIDNGDLREMKAASLGIITGAAATNMTTGIVTAAIFEDWDDLEIPNGSVGLLAATAPTGILSVSTLWNTSDANFDNGPETEFIIPYIAIGGNVEEINGAGTVYMDLACDQGIGTIQGANTSTSPASFIDVNADNIGNDGIIGLISVSGDFGANGPGGPGIVTNDGGYVRYMHVGGTIFQDAFFGGGFDTTRTYQPGVAATVTDDTGATLTLQPTGTVATLVYNNGLNTTTTTIGPQIELLEYGIRDKGGGVIVDAESLGGGMTITANGSGTTEGEADISEIQFVASSITTITATGPTDSNGEPTLVVNAGTPYMVNGSPLANGTGTTSGTDTTTGLAATGTETISGATDISSIIINGNVAVDVLDIVGLETTIPLPSINTTSSTSSTATTTITNLAAVATTASGNVDQIMNNTPGEIASINIPGSVQEIFSAGTLGLIQSVDGVAMGLVNTSASFGGNTLFGPGNTYPFNLQSTGIAIGTVNSGLNGAMTIEADEGLGNINIDHGSVEHLDANFNGVPTAGQFDGIDGPIVALAPFGDPVNGRLLNVDIGQGILPTGTGNVGFSGLFTNEDVGTVTNNGVADSDIRGNIVSNEKIDNIALTNGSIIGANIVSVTNAFSAITAIAAAVLVTQQIEPNNVGQPTYELGKITISGRGGIIGTDLLAADIGPTTVSAQGFGIFTTQYNTVGDGTIGTITAGGYGFRDSETTQVAVIQGINASGNGTQMPASDFTTDLRLSEIDSVDPYFGVAPDDFTDLDAVLGTSITAPIITTQTDTGVIEDDVIVANATLGAVAAQTIRTKTAVFQVGEANPEPFIPQPGQIFPMQINVVDTITSVKVRGYIDGLQLTTGRLGSFVVGGSVSRLGISVAGLINSLVIPGNFGQQITSPSTDLPIPDSYIDATGQQGSINSLTIRGNLNGNVTADVGITSLVVGGNVVGTITAEGRTTGLTLGTLRIGGSQTAGSLVIDGSAGSIITNGGLGGTGSSITIEGSLNLLSVGASHAKGSILASALHVEGALKTLMVYGQINGALTVDSDVTTMRITNDGTNANGDVINAPILISGRLGTAMITNGNIDANVTVNSTITRFIINKGSLLAGVTLQSQLDAIRNFTIMGGAAYGMYGNLLATGGNNQNITISGNIGDGTDAASIIALSGANFRVHGSILANTSINVVGQLNLLQVGGNIEAGAIIAAHPLKKLIVHGTNNGTITSM